MGHVYILQATCPLCTYKEDLPVAAGGEGEIKIELHRYISVPRS